MLRRTGISTLVVAGRQAGRIAETSSVSQPHTPALAYRTTDIQIASVLATVLVVSASPCSCVGEIPLAHLVLRVAMPQPHQRPRRSKHVAVVLPLLYRVGLADRIHVDLI